MIRKTLFTAAVLLYASTCEAQEVRIGFWNIEHLGKPSQRFGNAKDVAQQAEDLAVKIREMNVAILGLAEIYDTDENDGTRTEGTLDRVMQILSEERGQTWHYRLFRNRNLNDKSQVTGVAWNEEAVQRIGEPFRIPIEDTSNQFNEWDRHPYGVKFQLAEGKTDVVVVPMHMKAGTSTNNKNQRKNEAEFFLDALPELQSHFSDEDIILIGDTNVTPNEDTLDVLTTQFNDLFPGGTTVTFGTRVFDRVFVPKNQPEFSNSTQQTLTVPSADRDEHRINLSDHFPIVVTVELKVDDD